MFSTPRGARLVISMVLAGITVLGTPRPAAATTTGGGYFAGVAMLGMFPCPTTPCIGSFSGSAALSLSGVGTSSLDGAPLPYTAIWIATPGNLTAGFNYDETCEPLQPAGTPPVAGTAEGTFMLTGGLVTLAGGLPTTGTLNGSFNWLRVGTAVTISLFTLSITTTSGTTAVNLLDLVAGQSAAGFVWTNGPGTCPANGQANQTAEVAGVALQPA